MGATILRACGVVAIALALSLSAVGCVPITGGGGTDADLVAVLPALDHQTFMQQRAALLPWLNSEHLPYELVTLEDILAGRDPSTLTAEDVRVYLREHFTARPSTEARPRYLALFAPPSATYVPAGTPYAVIPRFTVDVGGNAFESDLPFEFPSPTTIDGGDGVVDPSDLNLAEPTFDVFRIPVTGVGDMQSFVARHNEFMAAPYRNDATLVAGEFGLRPGDSSAVQCLNAANLAPLTRHVLKVFDSTAGGCAPDILTSPSGPRLGTVLADAGSPFQGGTIVDVSHGSPAAIYAASSTNVTFANLSTGDVPNILTSRLNVFISIACDNDAANGTTANLAEAMYEQASVAVISATTQVAPVGVADTLYAEVDSVKALFDKQETLLQNLHTFRADYYNRFVLPATGVARTLLWTNLLAVDLVGDGLLTVAQQP